MPVVSTYNPISDHFEVHLLGNDLLVFDDEYSMNHGIMSTVKPSTVWRKQMNLHC
jgi:hypothetical protein